MSAVKRMRIPANDFLRYSVANKARQRRGVIRDVVTYNGDGSTKELRFFSDVSGKNKLQTNLTTAGKLPSGWSMLVDGIQVLFRAGVDLGRLGANADFDVLNDTDKFYNSGLLTFKVGQDVAVEDGPLMLFPGNTRLISDTAVADSFTAGDSSAAVSSVVSLAGKPFSDFEPFLIASGQDFTCVVSDLVGALPSGVNATVMIRVLGDIVDLKV